MSGALRRGIPTSRAALFGAITKAKNFEILPCDRHFPPASPPASHASLCSLQSSSIPPSGLNRPRNLTMATTVDAKLLRQTKFPPEFSRKVDMTKVNIEVMKK